MWHKYRQVTYFDDNEDCFSDDNNEWVNHQPLSSQPTTVISTTLSFHDVISSLDVNIFFHDKIAILVPVGDNILTNNWEKLLNYLCKYYKNVTYNDITVHETFENDQSFVYLRFNESKKDFEPSAPRLRESLILCEFKKYL